MTEDKNTLFLGEKEEIAAFLPARKEEYMPLKMFRSIGRGFARR